MTTLNSELLIDSKILRENISYIKSKLKNQTNFMSVIKSDAYGHNLELIIKDIDDISDGYGVVRIEEAIKIRKLSDKKILFIGTKMILPGLQPASGPKMSLFKARMGRPQL